MGRLPQKKIPRSDDDSDKLKSPAPQAVVDRQPFVIEYAELWRAADKVVYSTTLAEVSSARTRIERSFDPDSVRRLKATSERDLSVGGPHLAAEAIELWRVGNEAHSAAQ